ncbi:MAG: sodium:proton antiporter [Bacteroidetes bacterium]|nr:MAG: sodium:proton antiporter [Bacteroidota bacterium]
MFIAMIVVFVLGYTAIALEHPLKVDKAASALILGTLTWVLYIFGGLDIVPGLESFQEYLSCNPEAAHLSTLKQIQHFIVNHELIEHLGEISEILFFLLGAMTIVENVDAHEGFKVITDRIKTTNRVKLLWIISFITFFMSATLDNLTTTIVIIALLRKLIDDQKDRWFFVSMVVLAANAGGAWSPIGDVTTIMLWIGGQVTTAKIVVDVFVPSMVTMLLPLILLSFTLKGHVTKPEVINDGEEYNSPGVRKFMFFLGVGSLLFVPVFKTITHLPPYMGMLLGLGVMWVITDLMHRNKPLHFEQKFTITGVLKKVEIPTILFFLGILSAVAALQSAGHLQLMATYLDENLHNIYLIDLAIGLLSSIVDNVPLVAGAMGMYPIHTEATINMITDPAAQEYARHFMQDGAFWEFLAYTAGTGGSILIIGSAAGVAAMGLEKIDFIWYLKRISLLALLGYLGGAAVFYLMFGLAG